MDPTWYLWLEEENLWPVKMRSTSQAGHLRPDHPACGEWRALPWLRPGCGRMHLAKATWWLSVMEGILRPMGKKRLHVLSTCHGGISLVGPAKLPQCLLVGEQSLVPTAAKGMPGLYACGETPFLVLPSCLVSFGGSGQCSGWCKRRVVSRPGHLLPDRFLMDLPLQCSWAALAGQE